MIVGHREWAERILEGFSWGHAFFEVNGGLLERYARCKDAEEVKEAQEMWLRKLDREWEKKREGGKGEAEDEWIGGNPNHGRSEDEDEDEEVVSEEDEDDEDEDQEEEEEEEVEVEGKRPPKPGK